MKPACCPPARPLSTRRTGCRGWVEAPGGGAQASRPSVSMLLSDRLLNRLLNRCIRQLWHRLLGTGGRQGTRPNPAGVPNAMICRVPWQIRLHGVRAVGPNSGTSAFESDATRAAGSETGRRSPAALAFVLLLGVASEVLWVALGALTGWLSEVPAFTAMLEPAHQAPWAWLH